MVDFLLRGLLNYIRLIERATTVKCDGEGAGFYLHFPAFDTLAALK
uniref:Uncharacterized protein n=1 Tax=Podoviridae sp. ctnCN2 TaxID=2825274 RepID=A0A8S5PLI6_9CAUD|nr:MAG TPA: hypothetical protein [Podoviridae sp. ctnCN2]